MSIPAFARDRIWEEGSLSSQPVDGNFKKGNVMKVFVLISAVLIFFVSGTHVLGQKAAPADARGSKHIAADAPQGTGITINAPVSIRQEGQTFDAHFMVSSVTGLGIISYQMDIHYDASILQYNGCLTSGTISSSGILTCNGATPGLVKLVWTNTAPLVNAPGGPPSNLFKISFTVIGSNGDVSPLTFSALQVMEFAVPAVAIPGSITIGAPTSAVTSIHGRVLTHEGQPVPRARIFLTAPNGTHRMALSNPFGYYRFFDVPTGESYVIGAVSKRFTFTSQFLPVGEEIMGFTLIADP